jgi:hypothetical protein
VTATVPNQTAGVDELFAPGSFITLTQAEALNRPAFERLPGGVVAAGGPDLAGATQPQATAPVEFRKVRGETWLALVGLLPTVVLDLPAALLAMVAARDQPSVVATTTPLVAVGREAWVSAADGSVHEHATGAFQAARLAGGPAFAAAAADVARPAALAGL